jgi:hypothetical protein
MGGGNGQYLCEYSSDRCRAEGGSAGRHRYIVSRYSGAYAEMKRKGYKVHAAESPYRKLLALHAEVIFAPHTGVRAYAGLDNFERRWFADLFSARVAYIRHELSVHRAPGRQARYIDNAEICFCASESERDILSQSVYGYKPSMIRVTGLPRFDGLVSYPENVILIAPTWRGSAAPDKVRPGDPGVYSPGFTGTAYFDEYSRLLTDSGLLALADDNGYIIVFIVHPELSPQTRDFEEFAGGAVDVVSPARRNYEQYLNQSAILVTDYGSSQYDFAYMGKPVVYYRPESIPPTARRDGFDYDAMDFGPVAADPAELTALLEPLIKSAADDQAEPTDGVYTPPPETRAAPDEVYATRARNFFAHHDRENRGRIYDEIEKEFGR